MPFAKLTAACLPKMRLKPAPGDILESFGLSASPDQTSRCCIMLPASAASASRPGPSVRIDHALAIRPRSGTSIPPPIEPEKVDMTSVPPAITNQVLISWLLATSPRSSASSRRFWVGSSVLSEASFSSAMNPATLSERHHVAHDADEIIEETSHHRRDDQGEN